MYFGRRRREMSQVKPGRVGLARLGMIEMKCDAAFARLVFGGRMCESERDQVGLGFVRDQMQNAVLFRQVEAQFQRLWRRVCSG